MKKITKIVALLLALLTVIPSAIACNKEESVDAEGIVSTKGGDGEYDANGYLNDYIPDEIDYEGAEVTILGWSDEPSGLDFYDDGQTGDTLSDEVYKRNLTVEDRLGIELVYNLIPGNNQNRSAFIATATNALLMGSGDYDILACYSMNAASIAMQDALVDMTKNDYLHFDAPWWNDTLVKQCSIGDALYFCSGDIAPSALLQAYAMQVNLDMADDKQVGDPRELVKSGEWTLDALFEMTKNLYEDNGATGQDFSDSYGIVLNGEAVIDCFLVGSDITYMSRNRNNEYVLSDSFESEKTYDLISLLTKKMYVENDIYKDYTGGSGDTANYLIFSQERALFTLVDLNGVIKQKSKVNFTYSVIPLPKYDKEQEDYKITLGFPYTMYSIPQNAQDVDKSALTLECLASEGYRQLRPTIYETVKYQNANDELDLVMFDTIINGITFDLGRVFHELFTWDASPVALFRDCVKKNNTGFYRVVASQKSATGKVLDALTEKAAS